MELADFQALVSNLRIQRPNWFRLQSDPPATDTEIESAQRELKAELPKTYRDFVREFGGGDFVFGNVFSVSVGSDWNIVHKNSRLNIPGFVAISENGVGDYYGFQTTNGRCDSRVFFLDHEECGALKTTEYSDVFEFLVDTALRY